MGSFFERIESVHLNTMWLYPFFKYLQAGKWSSMYLFFRIKLDFEITDYTQYTSIMGMVGVGKHSVVSIFDHKHLKYKFELLMKIHNKIFKQNGSCDQKMLLNKYILQKCHYLIFILVAALVLLPMLSSIFQLRDTVLLLVSISKFLNLVNCPLIYSTPETSL